VSQRLPERSAPISLLWKFKRFVNAAEFSDLPGRHLKTIGYFFEEDKQGLYSPSMLRALEAREALEIQGARHYLENAFTRAKSEDFVNRLLYVDMVTYLPECLMAKVDIATMANSLEGRSPFLDHEFMELAYRMPGDWKLKGLKGHKWILKEAFKDKLPKSILRRGKMGFGSPIGPWFRGPLRDYWQGHVLSSKALSRDYFNEPALRRIWDEHQSGRRDHGYRLWALLMLELWHQECVEDKSRNLLQPVG
jgi:asparagine synthase (glutamine-hydrolysing)